MSSRLKALIGGAAIYAAPTGSTKEGFLMRNKLYAILLGIACFGVLLACEIPESVTLKGSPGIYTNLGSPFGKENTLLDVLNGDGIADRLGEGDGRTYTYTGDTTAQKDVKTYLLSFPLIQGYTPSVSGTMPTVSGEIPNLALHEIADFLGGVKFQKVPAYLYISGISGGTMTLSYKILNTETVLLTDAPITNTGENPFQLSPFADRDPGIVTWESADGSITGTSTTDLKDAFNAKTNVTLRYTISGNITAGTAVKADLVIKLPLRFSAPTTYENEAGVNVPVQTYTIDGTSYTQLNLDSLPKGDEDLFGREEGSDDNLFSQLDWVEIVIKSIDNNSVENLYLGMIKESGTGAISLNDDGNLEPQRFENDDLDKVPFNPIRLLMKQSDILTVKPAPDGKESTFDFKMAVSAKTKLNIKF